MADFDSDFESNRLAMLAQQYPEIVSANGRVIFNADADEDRLSGTRWRADEDIFVQLAESGFKHHLMELLDIFIIYRGQCNELPKEEGIVRFGDGKLVIEWLPDGTIRL